MQTKSAHGIIIISMSIPQSSCQPYPADYQTRTDLLSISDALTRTQHAQTDTVVMASEQW